MAAPPAAAPSPTSDPTLLGASGANRPLVFTNVRVFTGTDLLQHGAVVIENGRVRQVSTSPEDLRKEFSGAVVFDGQGRFTLLPGLFDCHVHLTLGADASGLDSILKQHTPELAIKAGANAAKTLAAGFTTVRDLGSSDYIGVGLRKCIDQGVIPGPRVIAAGQALAMTGGHTDPPYPPGFCLHERAVLCMVVDSADEARKAARKQLKHGVDVLKLCATGGVLTEGSVVGAPQLTVEEMRPAIEEFHKLGKKAAAHAIGSQGIKNAVTAGIDTVEHASLLDKEGIEMMLARNVVLVPTLCAPYWIIANISALPPFVQQKAAAIGPGHYLAFGAAVKAGVRVAMGTDAGTPFNRHGENAYELALMVQHGMTPLAALAAATSVAAETVGVAADRGTVAPGQRADLLLVEGDPVADIAVLQDKKRLSVFKDGKLVAHHGVVLPI